MFKNVKLFMPAIRATFAKFSKEGFKLGYQTCLQKIKHAATASEGKAISKEGLEKIMKIIGSEAKPSSEETFKEIMKIMASEGTSVEAEFLKNLFSPKAVDPLHFHKNRSAYLAPIITGSILVPATALATAKITRWVTDKSDSKKLQEKLDASEEDSNKKDKALLAKDIQIVALEAEVRTKDVQLAAKDNELATKDNELATKDKDLDSFSKKVLGMSDQLKVIKERYEAQEASLVTQHKSDLELVTQKYDKQISFLTQTLTNVSLMLLKNMPGKSSWFGFFRNNDRTGQSDCDIMVEENDEKGQVTINLLKCK